MKASDFNGFHSYVLQLDEYGLSITLNIAEDGDDCPQRLKKQKIQVSHWSCFIFAFKEAELANARVCRSENKHCSALISAVDSGL